MKNRDAPIIDMTRNGEFIDRPKASLGTVAARIAAFALILLFAAAAFWLALFIIPLILVLAVAGYFVLRHQIKHGKLVVTRRF